MSASVPNKKISKIIIFFDSTGRHDTRGPSQPSSLCEVALNKKPVEIAEQEPLMSMESGTEASLRGISDENETTNNETSCETGAKEVDSQSSGNESVLLKIKEEPEENFEIENVEDEDSSNIEGDSDHFLYPNIKDEPETIFVRSQESASRGQVANKENANCDTHPSLRDLVNRLIDTKMPKNNKQDIATFTNHNTLAGTNTSANDSSHLNLPIGNITVNTKGKESKCSRCTLIQTAFNALACANCRQILEPLWKIGVGPCSKTYRCKYANCSKSYARQGDLKIHHRVHTGERPYACSICEKRFSANNNLRRHLKVHTGDKPFTCQHCGKPFMTNSCLKRHVRVHTSSAALSTSFEYGKNMLQNP